MYGMTLLRHTRNIQNTKASPFDISKLLFNEAVCFTSMSLLVQTELLCFSFGREKTVSKLFKIIILSFLNIHNETSTTHNSNGMFCPIFHMLNDHFCKLKAHLVLATFMLNKCVIKNKTKLKAGVKVTNNSHRYLK